MILVTGATGFIGGALAKRLLNDGEAVRLLVRSADRSKHLEDAGAEIIIGDMTDPASCQSACKGAKAVFHCAGMLGGWGIPEALMRRVNVDGTRNLLQAAAGAQAFIHTSSCGILGPLKAGEAANESRPHNPINIYERTKSEAEGLALSYSKRMRVVVVRPEFVYGPGDLHLLPLFRTVKAGRFLFFDGGRSTLHPTYIDDAVEGMLLAWKKGSPGHAFNIAGERPVSVKEFITSMASAMGKRQNGLSMPAPLARLAGRVLDHTWGVFAKPPLTEAQVRYLSESRAFDTRKARKVLGYEPKVSLDEGMRRTAAWYISRKLLG
jgi:nucleoside-diphosphate-sugar epimerase